MKTKRILSLLLAVLMLALASVSLASCKNSYEDETFHFAVMRGSNGDKTLDLKEVLDKKVTDLVIPAEFEELPVVCTTNTAFDGCTQLKKLTFSENIEYIYHAKNQAFKACSALEEIVFNCKYLKDNELQINYGSSKGVTVTLGKDSSFGSDVFSGSTNLIAVKVEQGFSDNSVLYFSDCTKLESITYGGTKAEWCALLGVTEGACYSSKLLGEETDLYKEKSITVTCSDGDLVFQNGKAA